eukprot:GFUD01013442.1.p1 GENE.GFUD01013442.1~~GFUD01013442.1.p1  ORF type:complete len:1133 (-),score=359.01 GFUD01013442.1:1165-4563(-)
MADLLNRVGRSAFSYLAGQEGGPDPGFIGSIVEVDGMQVQVVRLLGEGGYAFIYAAKELATGKEFALKRFLVFEEIKVKEVIQEIRLMKEVKGQGDFVNFVTAASVDHSQGKKVNKEFLLLMELCSAGDLAQLLRKTGDSLTPGNVCLVMGCLGRALQVLHTRSTPVTHRDIKLENLLVTGDGLVKLCDLGSATTTVHSPNPDWSMNQRTMLEDELAKYSTPMYRAPEMLDTWSNYPVNQAVDIWAAGLVLYSICFNKHPFDDSNKLAIVNGNYKLPTSDSKYRMYHSLISSMLSLDPRTRPTAGQVLDQLSAIAETHGYHVRGPLTLQASLPPTPPQDQPAPLPSGPTLISPDQPTNVSSFKASAGSLFSRLKDTSKAVVASVQQSMAGRDLDFHCITSRLGAMSFPAEGLESAYRNHIDDVKGMMESQHGGHYTVYNVSERSYPATKYPTGKLVQAGWPAGAVPSLDMVLDLCCTMLDFLSRDVRNVVVIHCLDGKSSTAYMTSALLLFCGLVTTAEAALAVFAGKRCDPALTAGQLASLTHLATLVDSRPPVLKSPFVTVSNLVIEPIPLFNKAGDGCRPFVELFQGKERVVSTLQEYSRMKGYSVTMGDEAATVPVNMTVCGDVTVTVSHARQALGALKPVKICQVQFHTSSLTPGRPSYSWALAQLDCLAELARYSDTFRLVMNCTTSEECSGRDMQWPDTTASMLLFNSDQDYEAVARLLPQTGIHHTGHSKFFVNNPELESVPPPPAPAPARPSPAVSPLCPAPPVDLLGLSDPSPLPSLLPGLSPPEVDLSSSSPSSINLLDPTPPPSAGQTFEFLADLGQPAASPAPPSTTSVPSPSSDSLSDLFGPQTPLSTPLLDITAMSRGTSQPDIKNPTNTSFDPFSTLTNLTASMSTQSLSGSTQPPKVGQPMNNLTTQKAPMAPNNLNLGMGAATFQTFNSAPTFRAPAQAQPAPQQMGPNYSRSFFSPGDAGGGAGGPSTQSGGVKPKVSTSTFDDLLGGFNPTAREGAQNQTIGAMKKTELVKTMDPDEAKIFDWREGKARNIRSLLCSLHKIIWSGARWTECGMHQLVTKGDVKKMYRKACLAVHPDKQMGTDNENISKLIFMELNEAWSEFENDPNQQNMFG